MQKINIGTIIRHTHRSVESFYIVGSAGDSEFVLINLVYGTRASSPNRYSYPMTLEDIRNHMGSLLEKESELLVLEDCVLSFAVAPVEPLKGTIAIGRGN